MWEYLQINISIFCLALLALIALRKAPAKFRFGISVIGMLVWLVPWQHVSISLPSYVANHVLVFKAYELQDVASLFNDIDDGYQNAILAEGPIDHSAHQKLEKTFQPVAAQQNWYSAEELRQTLLLGFIVLTFTGLCYLLYEYQKYQSTLKRWMSSSTSADHLKSLVNIKCRAYTIRHLKGCGPGMMTGLFRPIIWIDPRYSDESTLKSILIHEINHIKGHDAFWMAVIRSIRALFWWNPMIWYLYRRAREDIEIRCDERCVQNLKHNAYILSLARLVLMDNSAKYGLSILGWRDEINFNVKRVLILNSSRIFSPLHLIFLCAFLVATLFVSVAVSYDEKLADFLDGGTDLQIKHQHNVIVEYEGKYKDLYAFTQLLTLGKWSEAEEHYWRIKAKANRFDSDKRLYTFLTLAAYLGETQRFSEIPELLEDLDLESHRKSWSLLSVLAIAYIRTDQFDAAIELIEGSGTLNHRGYRLKLLLAQAYHMKGQYEQSNAVITQALSYTPMRVDQIHRLSMSRLMGKNYVLLGEWEAVARTKQALGDDAPENFNLVRANAQSIPYQYFGYKTVNGQSVDGFEERAFPLKKILPELNHPIAQEIHRKSVRLAHLNNFAEARTVLEQGLERLSLSEDVQEEDLAQIIEYLFVLNMRVGDKDALLSLSKKIVDMPNITLDIRARAHWALSSGNLRASLEGTEQFNRYSDLFPQGNLALDHEMIFRVFQTQQFEEATESLTRVIDFYSKLDLVPDMKTLNSMITLLSHLGFSQLEARYKAMFAKHYPKAIDFSLDDWRV